MKFKSQLITQASGSIGGVTFSHNSYGLYTRARSIPVNPLSQYQVAQRNRMANVVELWTATLTESEREAWRTYAANVAMTDKLGSQIYLSGFAQFVRSVTAALQSDATWSTYTAPPDYLLAAGTTPSLFGVDGDNDEVDIAFTNTDDWANEDGGAMLVYASRTQNVGRSFFAGPYRYVGAVAGDSVTPPTSPATFSYPFPSESGQKVFGYVRFLRADNRLSTRVHLEGLVTVA